MGVLKFSVIIPVYNTERFLPECLLSIIEQTVKDIEIICVDNGSTDKSIEVLKIFQKRDERIKILSIGKSDAGTARNAGLKLAKGEYLYFIDSDDFCENSLLEECYKKIKKDRSDVLVFSADQFDMATNEYKPMPHSLVVENLPKALPFKPVEMKERIFNSFQNWPWNKIFRRDFIEKNNILFQEVARTNDMRFTSIALVEAASISVLNEVLIHYRVGNKKSLQATNHLAPVAFWDAYKETKRELIKRGMYEMYERSFLNAVVDGTVYNYLTIKSEVARKYIYFTVRYGGEVEFGLMKHGGQYYYNKNNYNIVKDIEKGKTEEELVIEGLRAEDAERMREIEVLKKGIEDIKSSFSHKVGLWLTWVPRSIKKIIRGN